MSTGARHLKKFGDNLLGRVKGVLTDSGGLVRSAGGWSAVKALRMGFERIKRDEHILGDGDFVETVLKETQEQLERK